MSQRILVVAMSLAIAYATVYLGDGVGQILRSAADQDPAKVLWLPLIFACAISVISGLIFFAAVISKPDSVKDDVAPWFAAVALCFGSFPFGAGAMPFTHFGPALWRWASHGIVFELLVLVPTILVAHDIVLQALERKRSASEANNVTPIRRNRDSA